MPSTRALTAAGHDVVVLTRRPVCDREVGWDGETLGPWTKVIDGCDVVINLAGRSVSCRYTAANLQTMMASRVNSARVVGEAIAIAAQQVADEIIAAHGQGTAHIQTRFNAGIGTANCLPNLSWYYGLDTNVPAGQVSLLTTLLHEFSHGLGFASFVNPSNGALSGPPAPYDFHVFDETQQSIWANYGTAQRAP